HPRHSPSYGVCKNKPSALHLRGVSPAFRCDFGKIRVMTDMPHSAKTLLIVVHLLGLACLFGAVFIPLPSPAAPLWELMIYGGLSVVAGARKFRVTYRNTEKESGSLSLGFPIIFAALLRGGPLAGSAVAIASCLSSCLYPRRHKP